MALFSKDEKTSSESLFREIQTEHMIYQISSTSDIKKVADKMMKGIEEITKDMENARNTAYAKKIAVDELKIKLYAKKDKMKKLQQESTRTRKHVELIAKKKMDLETEVNKIKNVIERIRDNTKDLDSKYLEQSQSELMDSLIKMTLETERAHSDLSAAKKIETITSKKLNDVEMDFNKLEAHTSDKISETERLVTNVSTTIEHIVKSYDEITTVSRDLLKSAISTKIEFEKEDNYMFGQTPQHQEFNDSKVAIQSTDSIQ
jgi:chromosome segregation ATPase